MTHSSPPSTGRRFLTVGVLTLLMSIPTFFAAEVVGARADYQDQTAASIGQEWGGPQVLSGPVLVIPVQTTVTRIATRPRLDPQTGAQMFDKDGKELFERFRETVTERSAPVYLLPETFDADLTSQTQDRARGIFRVPVYTARLAATFDFAPEAAEAQIGTDATLLWDEAELRLSVSDNRALRGVARLEEGGAALPLEPMTDRAGLKAALGDPRNRDSYALTLGLNGAQRLMLTPMGRDSRVTLAGDWPHPSFGGAFLPDDSTVTGDGFTAQWTIPHLARTLPQAGRSDPDPQAREETAFGLSYITPNDFYQKAWRAARYGILFVGLTFLTILLIDRTSARPAHPVQYLLAGLAQTTFVLLMVSYAEQIGFDAAYLLSSGAVIALLTLFGVIGLKLGLRALLLGAVLTVVYAVLYVILRSADHALIAGSTLAFAALALTMVATRNEDWHGPERDPKAPGPLRRMLSGNPPPTPQA